MTRLAGSQRAAQPLQTRRREEVLAAAAECFMRLGYEATSMDDVAEALGATKGRVYHHYTSKPELFFAVYRRAMEMQRENVLPIAKQAGPANLRLIKMANTHVLCLMEARPFQRTLTMGVNLYRFGANSPEHAVVLEELMDERRDYELIWRKVLSAGRRDGTLHVPDTSVSTRTLLGGLNWVSMWYSPRPGETRRDREKLAERVVDTVLGGYLAR